ncbi:MAG: transposase [Chloroflexi bacterium]|nr:transposase [Chloroflexota bacterium]
MPVPFTSICLLMRLGLSQRFQFHYTPKSASWLNMIEIEFSALARLCLKRRIRTMEKLEAEVLALIAERHAK